jgi:hypothetical protein
MRWENKIRDAGGRDYRLQGLTKEEILHLGSRHPRYVVHLLDYVLSY